VKDYSIVISGLEEIDAVGVDQIDDAMFLDQSDGLGVGGIILFIGIGLTVVSISPKEWYMERAR